MTRHELKEQLQHDRFTDTVSEVVGYAVSNRELVIRWSIALAIVLAIAGGIFWYRSQTNSVRERDLDAAFAVISAPVGPAAPPGLKSFPTEQAKTQAELKALQNVVSKDGGSRQGLIAQYYLGALKAQNNDPKGAEADLRPVANSSSACAPLAKIALAQVYAGENRMAEAQQSLRDIVNKPTDLVSKDQAEVMLARLDSTTHPQQTKQILQSLKTSTDPAVSRAVEQITAQLAK